MTTIATIRILIQDVGATPILSDDAISSILEVENNTYYAAAICCSSIAAYYGSKTNMTVDIIKISNSQKFEHYTALAKEYNRIAKDGRGSGGSTLVGSGVIVTGVSESEIASVESDSDRVEPSFSTNMFENLDGKNEEIC